MKKLAAVLATLAVVFGLWSWWAKTKNAAPSNSPSGIASQNNAVSTALSKQNSNVVGIIQSNFAPVQSVPGNAGSGASRVSIVPGPAPAGAPTPALFTNFLPGIVLENVRRAVRQYGDMYGGNPVGTNPEITSQLNGNNPKHINFVNADAGMQVNAQGEMIDAWGTPFFFHQISASDMEIHSAGPDKVMWTADDLVFK